MCRVLRASGRRHPPRRGAGSRQKSLLLAGAEHRLCVQESTGLQGSSAASTTLGQPPKTGSGLPSPYRGGGALAGCCSPDHGIRALTIPGGAGCRGHRHLLPPDPLLSGAPGVLLSGTAFPAQLPHRCVLLGARCPARTLPGRAAGPTAGALRPRHRHRSGAGSAVAPCSSRQVAGGAEGSLPLGWRPSLPLLCSPHQARRGSQREAPASSSDASRKD